ncbi:alpha-1,2-fucosyltransferase [Maribacter dokdonensis]|uniref:alpha-1,2-fucosyltransferase n=1 Tax=Maribacter dokdonensis TaxID=320912 RepID=UPI002AAFDDC4|nr:alpha-1,2-fucosyltransferase [Maribacter dokdonensis]
MIIATITDRLGNQLFQYATAKALAVRNKTKVKINTNFYDSNAQYKASYELDNFCIPQIFASKNDLYKYMWPSDNIIYRILRQIYPKHTYFEKSNCYDNNIEKLGDKVALRGFWQSYKYFDSIRPILIKEFKIKNTLNELNQSLATDIKKTNSVSLHIRRGDYVANQNFNNLYGTCSLEYYQTAIQIISNQVEHITIFCFSDDIPWVKKNLNIDIPCIFIDHNVGDKSYLDIHLMSLCKHNIIANSSFSWWGAWLNQNNEKIVIAPKKWYNDTTKNTKDLCPPNWLRI